MFCPKCGRESEEEGLCKACFLEKYVIFEIPKVLEVRVCPKCPSYKSGERWVATKIENFEELVKMAANKVVKQSICFNKEVTSPKATITQEFVNPNILQAHVSVEASIMGRKATNEAFVEIRVRKETCDICSRIAGGYYEGVIQIRAQNRFPTKREVARSLKIVDEVIAKAEKAGDRLAFVTDVFELPEGADIYIGSINAGRQISRAITDEIGGTVQESPKLVGMKEGKDLYRINFSVRLPDIVAGDIVRMHGNTVLVEKVGKRISGTNLSNGHSTSAAEDEKLEKVSDRSKAAKTVLVSEEGNFVQILDPESYVPVTIKKPLFLKRSPGDEVWAIKTADGVFLLPGGDRGKE
jgi:nonsense-mediated mRNA decay protein 3